MDFQTKCSNGCGDCIHKTVCNYEAPGAGKKEEPMINFREDLAPDFKLEENHRESEFNPESFLRSAEKGLITKNAVSSGKTLNLGGELYGAEVHTYLQDVNNFHNPSLAMAILLNRMSKEKDDHDPQSIVLTVNLGNTYSSMKTLQLNQSFIDINNLMGELQMDEKQIQDFLKENFGAEPVISFGSPVSVQSGFVSYPLYEFDPEKLKAFDEYGYEAYEKDYLEAFKIEQKALFDNDFEFEEP